MNDDREMNFAPIVLFVYNRPEHTKRTIESLQKNTGAGESILYIYSDGAKGNSVDAVEKVRQYIGSITGFKKVEIILREQNMGLAASVIAGVTEVITRHGKVIVMEDDIEVTPHFLSYMNEALQRYANSSRVFAVTGFSYFPKGTRKLPETYFAKLTESWTWATWKEKWDYFDPEARGWKELLDNPDLCREFNDDNSFNFSGMLYRQMHQDIDSWAVRWAYTMFIQNGLTLYVNKSLCRNIGFDGTGVHSEADKKMSKRVLHEGRIEYWPDEIREEPAAHKQICKEMGRQRRAYVRGRIKHYFIHPSQAVLKINKLLVNWKRKN